MAFLQGIFGNQNRQQPQTQQQAPNQQQNIQQQPQGNQQPGGGAGSQQQQPANSQFQGAGGNNGGQPANPLDAWTQRLTPPKPQEGQGGNQQAEPNKGLYGDMLSPEALGKAFEKTSFTANLNQEDVSAALGGDAAALMRILDMQGRNIMQAAVGMSGRLAEHGINSNNSKFDGTLDSRMRDFMIRNQNATKPQFDHPLAKSMLSAMKSQFARSNPTASPQEITTMAENFLMDFSNTMRPADGNQGKGDNQQNQGSNQPDWSSFLDDSDGNQAGQQPQGNQNFGNFM